MKLLKIKIFRTAIITEFGTHKHFEYPDDYNPKKIKFGPIYELEDVPRPEKYCYIIIGVDDIDHDQFKNAITSTKISEHIFETTDLTQEEAIIIGTPWIIQYNKIADEEIVLALCLKIAAKEKLTAEELNKLNPDSLDKGINKTKSFTELLDTSKGK